MRLDECVNNLDGPHLPTEVAADPPLADMSSDPAQQGEPGGWIGEIDGGARHPAGVVLIDDDLVLQGRPILEAGAALVFGKVHAVEQDGGFGAADQEPSPLQLLPVARAHRLQEDLTHHFQLLRVCGHRGENLPHEVKLLAILEYLHGCPRQQQLLALLLKSEPECLDVGVLRLWVQPGDVSLSASSAPDPGVPPRVNGRVREGAAPVARVAPRRARHVAPLRG
mmetsp:Transcript_79342/g.250654  ORF Transcript_79342/g.250654 Transcript_79342/m.250654 type:complete len:224 (-) Transcript_79342:1067-1738(-)